jgi:hypothetical protein
MDAQSGSLIFLIVWTHTMSTWAILNLDSMIFGLWTKRKLRIFLGWQRILESLRIDPEAITPGMRHRFRMFALATAAFPYLFLI